MDKTENRGGKREGAGRPRVENRKETKMLTYRVPLDKAEFLDKKIKEIISKKTRRVYKTVKKKIHL